MNKILFIKNTITIFNFTHYLYIDEMKSTIVVLAIL